METPALTRPRLDPVLVLAFALACTIAAWVMAPMATGVTLKASDTRIEVEVPILTSVTPGWTAGDTDVRLEDVALPGEPRDATSSGWRMSTNWARGYEVRIRSTTDPALRGNNAIDGNGAKSAFADYTTASCPCPWNVDEFKQGVFGYSVSVASSSGSAPLDTAKWGSERSRKWRGFTRSSYRAYSTAGGSGQYTMAIHLRSMIPDGAVQREGSYRAGLVVSVHPLT